MNKQNSAYNNKVCLYMQNCWVDHVNFPVLVQQVLVISDIGHTMHLRVLQRFPADRLKSFEFEHITSDILFKAR